MTPRNGDEAFAAAMGLSPSYARQLRRQLSPGDVFEEMDAELRAEASLADLDAVESIDAIDIADATSTADPHGTMDEIIRGRSERSLRARIAANERWSREDPAAQGRRMREGFDARFEREIDAEFPGLNQAERQRRIVARRKAYFARLALKSAQARRKGRT